MGFESVSVFENVIGDPSLLPGVSFPLVILPSIPCFICTAVVLFPLLIPPSVPRCVSPSSFLFYFTHVSLRPKNTFFPTIGFSYFFPAWLKRKLARLPNTFSRSSRLGSNSSLLLVPGREGSPMTSFDAETDLKPIIFFKILLLLFYVMHKCLRRLVR